MIITSSNSSKVLTLSPFYPIMNDTVLLRAEAELVITEVGPYTRETPCLSFEPWISRPVDKRQKGQNRLVHRSSSRGRL